MNRFGAFLIHLGISLVVFAILANIVIYVWYPDFFFASDGGWQGIRIIVFVDLVLGPLLTLVVFDRRKPELTRDLSIVALLQISCLIAGTYVVHHARPIALVYVDGYFYSMSERAYRELGAPVPDLASFPGPWPKRVVVKLPEDYAAQSEIRREALTNGTPLRVLAEHYAPMSYEELKVAREAVDEDELRHRVKGPGVVESWLSERDGAVSDYAFFHLQTRYGLTVLAISRATKEFAGVLFEPLEMQADRPSMRQG